MDKKITRNKRHRRFSALLELRNSCDLSKDSRKKNELHLEEVSSTMPFCRRKEAYILWNSIPPEIRMVSSLGILESFENQTLLPGLGLTFIINSMTSVLFLFFYFAVY